MIIGRYLLLETAKVFFAVVTVLLLIMASMLFLRTLEEVNVGALNVQMVLTFLGFQIVRSTPNLLPPAFFLAVIIALSRLARDSELVAMSACGISPAQRLRSLLLLALPVLLITGWMSVYLKPWAAAGIQEIRIMQQDRAAQIAGLQSGRFYLVEGGKLALFIGEIDRHQSLSDVFILDRRTDVTRLIVSQGGRHQLDPLTGEHLIRLVNGHRFDGNAGLGTFMIGAFDEYQIRVAATRDVSATITKRSTKSSAELWHSNDPADRAELERRLADPLAILVVTLMAVPIVALSPRQRGTGRFMLAFLAYFSFFNLQRLAESWLASGVTPFWLTSFWYQGVILAAVYLALLPESLVLKRLLRGRTARLRSDPAAQRLASKG